MSVKAHDSQLNSYLSRNKTFLAGEDRTAITSFFAEENSYPIVLCFQNKKENCCFGRPLGRKANMAKSGVCGSISAILL